MVWTILSILFGWAWLVALAVSLLAFITTILGFTSWLTFFGVVIICVILNWLMVGFKGNEDRSNIEKYFCDKHGFSKDQAGEIWTALYTDSGGNLNLKQVCSESPEVLNQYLKSPINIILTSWAMKQHENMTVDFAKIDNEKISPLDFRDAEVKVLFADELGNLFDELKVDNELKARILLARNGFTDCDPKKEVSHPLTLQKGNESSRLATYSTGRSWNDQ